MSKKIMERIDAARDNLGMSSKAIAEILKTDDSVLNSWRLGDVQDSSLPGRLTDLALHLKVEQEWLEFGTNPPEWFLFDGFVRGRGDIDWNSVTPVTKLYNAWFDFLNEKIFEEILRQNCAIGLPYRFGVCRPKFFQEKFGFWTDKLQKITVTELETLARSVGAWPERLDRQELLRKMPVGKDETHTTSSSPDSTFWDRLLKKLEQKARAFQKASRSPTRRMKIQGVIFHLLTEKLPNEPLLAGSVLPKVLSRCLQVAIDAEILGGMTSRIEYPITAALHDRFYGKSFSIREMGRYLFQHRGITMVGRGEKFKNHKTTISEDTVARTLKKIAESIKASDGGSFLIPPSGGERKWRVREVSTLRVPKP